MNFPRGNNFSARGTASVRTVERPADSRTTFAVATTYRDRTGRRFRDRAGEEWRTYDPSRSDDPFFGWFRVDDAEFVSTSVPSEGGDRTLLPRRDCDEHHLVEVVLDGDA